MDAELAGLVETNCGHTAVRVSFGPEDQVRIAVVARWMGDDVPLDVVVRCKHQVLDSHSGLFIVEGAVATETKEPFALPPSDGPIIIEYVRVPPQRGRVRDERSDAFTMVLWLHPDAVFDDGTDLEPDEYAVSPERFRPVARALAWLARPWKLG